MPTRRWSGRWRKCANAVTPKNTAPAASRSICSAWSSTVKSGIHPPSARNAPESALHPIEKRKDPGKRRRCFPRAAGIPISDCAGTPPWPGHRGDFGVRDAENKRCPARNRGAWRVRGTITSIGDTAQPVGVPCIDDPPAFWCVFLLIRDQRKDTQNAGNLPGIPAVYSIKSDSWDFTDKNSLGLVRWKFESKNCGTF